MTSPTPSYGPTRPRGPSRGGPTCSGSPPTSLECLLPSRGSRSIGTRCPGGAGRGRRRRTSWRGSGGCTSGTYSTGCCRTRRSPSSRGPSCPRGTLRATLSAMKSTSPGTAGSFGTGPATTRAWRPSSPTTGTSAGGARSPATRWASRRWSVPRAPGSGSGTGSSGRRRCAGARLCRRGTTALRTRGPRPRRRAQQPRARGSWRTR
mmetsp:Transcript_53611/g.170504  ORF Transcript_53611/g.170504 Transcript_53611/m.170504 type:complete len:206 (-) Transcript_53611:425-1042(-)